MRNVPISTLFVTLALVLAGSAVAESSPTAEQIDFFEKHVRPIFVDTCYECHGEEKQKANLRLDSGTAIAQGGDSGPIVNLDNLAASKLIEVVEYQGEIKMPEKMRLPDDDIAAIREWVLMGAPWPDEAEPGDYVESEESLEEFIARSREQHWAFQPVARPRLPETSNPDWVRTPVDAFVLARLDEANLKPSPEADRRTLLRRLSYDLIGLPPTPEEIEAFVADTRPDAYERQVERLLASPHYGERWARHWLDVARYADTKGYVFEEDRFFPYSYTYRDYVVRAFNEDKPYDEFVIEQIAADHLDLGEDRRPLAGLGFLTLGRRFLNVQNDIIDDRIDVVTRGFLGLTVTCARCHDHKFDPIDAKDYYALYGVFRSSYTPEDLPLIDEPDPNDPQYQEFVTLLEEKERDLRAYEDQVYRELLQEIRMELGVYFRTAHEARGIEDETAFKTLAQEREIRPEILRKWVDYLNTNVEGGGAIFKPYAWFAELPEEAFAEQSGAIMKRIAEDQTVNAAVREGLGEQPPETMAQVLDRYVDVFESVDDEWRERLAVYAQMLAHAGDVPPAAPVTLEDASKEAVRQVLYGADAPGNVPPGEVYGISETPIQQKIREKRRIIARHEATHPGRPDRAMALYDAGDLFDPYVFLRGKADNPGEQVPRRFVKLLSEGDPKAFEHGSGRLELARAIADSDNPLTARVFVNRMWMHLFGLGLVDTPSDFGLRSDPPSHPDLLDFLAASFMDGGWSVKDLQRMIVLSSTYRQTSDANAVGIEKDIENRLLWRQNRKRLDFESMRDSLLFASGELDLTLGGPPESLTDEPVTKRRAIYGLVERQNMAGFIRAFDFASPDAHSPKRFNTVVPQQALFLMNSPFVIDRARALATRVGDSPDVEQRLRELFQICVQREPSPEELAELTAFVERSDFDNGPEPPARSAWRYGYGYFNAETERVDTFVELETFKDGKWQVGDAIPDPELGYISLNDSGGHPGRDSAHATIHRWVAPREGTLTLSGKLRHPNEKGDGVIAYFVSGRDGLLRTLPAKNHEERLEIADVVVDKGDTIDVVISPGPTDSYDSYAWFETIRMDKPAELAGDSVETEWNFRRDFSGPLEMPEPLSPWGQLAQVLLLTNEFMYVD